MSNSDHLVEQGILIHKFELEKIFKTQSLVNSILDYSNLTTDGIYPYYLAHIDQIDNFLNLESNYGWHALEFPGEYLLSTLTSPTGPASLVCFEVDIDKKDGETND